MLYYENKFTLNYAISVNLSSFIYIPIIIHKFQMLLMKKCVLMNHQINRRLFVPKRLIHNEIWECSPYGAAKEPTILLFGYAGSPKKNLLKYEYADSFWS